MRKAAGRAVADIREDVERAAEAIEGACGKRPAGFRAPGYTVSDPLFTALEMSSIEYDSSVFPCPSYYAAKAATLASLKVRGRKSASILDGAAGAQGAVPNRAAVLDTGRRLVGAPDRRDAAAAPVHRHLAGAGW